MNRKELRAQLVAEMKRLQEIDRESGTWCDPRHNWGNAWFNVMQGITNADAPYDHPRRAYRETGMPFGLDRDDCFEFVRSSVRPSYGVCSAASGGRHARVDEGICPGCGEEVEDE